MKDARIIKFMITSNQPDLMLKSNFEKEEKSGGFGRKSFGGKWCGIQWFIEVK
jgi:hypothetical protein